MGWKGTLRSVQATARRIDRENQRQQREAARREKELQRQRELDHAAYEVEAFNDYISALTSLHTTCSERISWESEITRGKPDAPTLDDTRTRQAEERLRAYRPGKIDQLLRRGDKKRARLATKLAHAEERTQDEHRARLAAYEAENSAYEERRSLAQRVVDGDPESYSDVLTQEDRFSSIEGLGRSCNFRMSDHGVFTATIFVNDESVIPTETKSLLQSGKLSTKQTPKGQFYAYYQDHVCSAVLRVADELFALLPLESVFAHASANMLNSSTGYLEEQIILSAFIPRATLYRLNLRSVDPSDAMSNFVHNMAFMKTKGFKAVQKLDPQEIGPA